MTELLEKAVSAARGLPASRRDDIGEDEPIVELTPAEEADLIEAKAEMMRGEFATEDEVKAVLAKISRVRLRFQKRALSQIDRALGNVARHSPQDAATSKPV